MGDRCWNCKKWEEHFYCNHFEESKFHFLKIMDGDFTLKMEFPQKFVKNFRVELIDVVALEAPNGKLWEIGLCKEQDRLYFEGGWNNFIEENEIKKDYVLIFEYVGNSIFQIRIFDKTGRISAKTIDNRSDPSTRFIEDEHGMSKVKIEGRRVGSSKICKKEISEVRSYSKAEMEIWLRNSEDTIKILEQNFASKQGNYSFVRLITQSFMPYMAIPTEFVSKYNPRKPHGIHIYNQSNQKWYVNCSWRSTSWGFVGKPLFKLLHENKLKKGDACVFEVKKEKSKKLVMEMRIVRAKEVCSIIKKQKKQVLDEG